MTARELDHALGDSERVLIDSSAIIAFHNPAERVHALAKHLFGRIEDPLDPVHGCLSVVSAGELLVRPLRLSPLATAFMHSFLTDFPNLTLFPVDLAVAQQAASLRASAGLKMVDAIIVATGLLASCQAIVCNDERWKRRLAPLYSQFRWIYLADLEAGASTRQS